MSDVALAVGGATDRCRLCGCPVEGIDAAGAVGLDGVVCPGCAENIVHYTARCGYVGRPGGGMFALYRYHGHPSGAGGVVFLEPGDAAVASPRELAAYYRDLPRRVRRVVWWFAADAWPAGWRVEDLPGDATDVHAAVDPGVVADAGNEAASVLDRVPRPFVVRGTSVAVPAECGVSVAALVEDGTGASAPTGEQAGLAAFANHD